MSILGKIFILFNLLLAGGVGYFATQAWTQRQDQNATALRYYLISSGLPMEENPAPNYGTGEEEVMPIEFDMPGGHRVHGVRTVYLKKHFQGTETARYSPEVPPTSRVAEVKRVKEKVRTMLDGKPRSAAKLAYLIGSINESTQVLTPGLLIFLADTYEERQALKELLVRGVVDLAERTKREDASAKVAEELLYARFDSVISPASGNVNSAAQKKAVEDASAALATADKRLKEAFEARMTALTDALAAAEKFAKDTKSEVLKKEREDADTVFQKTMDDYAPAYKAWVAALDTMNKTIRVSTAGISYDEVDRRLRMTTLLMHLDFDMSEDAPKQEAWQKRVALVVGLPDYLAAIKHRTARLNANGGYLASIKNQRDQLEARFVEMYQYQLMVASYRDYLLEAQQKITKGLQEQAVKEVSLTAQRTTQRNVARADMDKIVAAVNAAVAEQSRIESDLFTIQKQVGQVLRENFELEDRIQAAEKVLQGIR